MWRGPLSVPLQGTSTVSCQDGASCKLSQGANPLTFRSLEGVGTPPSADSRSSPMPVMPTVLAAIIRDAPFAAYVHIRRPI
jgi:hypothetical protein